MGSEMCIRDRKFSKSTKLKFKIKNLNYKTSMCKENYFQLLKEVIERRIPFNKLIGLKIEKLDLESIGIRFKMRPELVGNFMRGNLHGGVISTVLDLTGGMVAWAGIMNNTKELSFEEVTERFAKIGTVDLRVDYLRPGLGKYFVSTGSALRTGNKLSVARMELHNDEGLLISVGTGSYVVG